MLIKNNAIILPRYDFSTRNISPDGEVCNENFKKFLKEMSNLSTELIKYYIEFFPEDEKYPMVQALKLALWP